MENFEADYDSREDLNLKQQLGKFFAHYFPEGPHIDDKDFHWITGLFRKILLQSMTDIDLLRDFYEIITNHEHYVVRNCAWDVLSRNLKNLPKDSIRNLFRLWLNYPVQEFAPILQDLKHYLKNSQEDQVLLNTAQVYLGEGIQQLSDLQLSQVEEFIRDKPLLYLPIQRKIDEFRAKDFSRNFKSNVNLLGDLEETDSGILIPLGEILLNQSKFFIKNKNLFWKKLLNSSLMTFINDFPQLLDHTNWNPINFEEGEIFHYFKELFQGKSWDYHSDILLEAIICAVPENWENYAFSIQANASLHQFSKQTDFIDLTSDKLEIDQFTDEKLLKSKIEIRFKGQFLYIITFTEWNVGEPVFDTQNGEYILGPIHIDLNFLVAFIKPIILLNGQETNALRKHFSLNNSNLSKSSLFQRMQLTNHKYYCAIEKLLNFQQSKFFELEYVKELPELPKEYEEINEKEDDSESKQEIGKQEKILVNFGIDFGNFKTTLAAIDVDKGIILPGHALMQKRSIQDVDVTDRGIILSSTLFIHPQKGILFGKTSSQEKNESFTFFGMKQNIRKGLHEHIYFEGIQFTDLVAAKSFFKFVKDKIIDFSHISIQTLCYSFPIDAPEEYKLWLKETLSEIFDIKANHLFSIDEATAACFGLVSLKKEILETGKKYLVVDMGGGTTDCTVLQFSSVESKDVQIFARHSEDFGGDNINKILLKLLCSDSGCISFSELSDREKLKTWYDLGQIKAEVNSNPRVTKSYRIRDMEFKIKLHDYCRDKILNIFKLRVQKTIAETLEEAKLHGLTNLDRVILTGGGMQLEFIRNQVLEVINESFPCECKYAHDPFTVVIGNLQISLGYSIHASLIEDIGILNFHQIDGKIPFDILLKKDLQYPSPYFQYKIRPFNEKMANSCNFLALDFRIIKKEEIPEDPNFIPELLESGKAGSDFIFTLESLNPNTIMIPNTCDRFWLEIDSKRRLHLFYYQKQKKHNYMEKLFVGYVR